MHSLADMAVAEVRVDSMRRMADSLQMWLLDTGIRTGSRRSPNFADMRKVAVLEADMLAEFDMAGNWVAVMDLPEAEPGLAA